MAGAAASGEPRRVSIALATYNGATYLAEQLASFAGQTRLPDELVVGDDNSRDETVAMLEAFAATVPFPVKITVNRPGLGPGGNFAATIARCTGDVVFLSDQDDIWHADKIARMLAFMDANPGQMIALHDAALVDGAGQPLGMTMGQQLESSGVSAAAGLVAGCCMAIDGRLARFYDPPPASPTHDAWLTAIADRFGLRAYLPEPLIDYRRHGANVSQSFMSGERRASRWARLRERIVRARAAPAGAALAAATASLASSLKAVETHRDVLASTVPEPRLTAGIAGMRADLARTARRRDIHEAPLSARPTLFFRNLKAGDYRGGQGLLSLLRDLADAARRT